MIWIFLDTCRRRAKSSISSIMQKTFVKILQKTSKNCVRALKHRLLPWSLLRNILLQILIKNQNYFSQKKSKSWRKVTRKSETLRKTFYRLKNLRNTWQKISSPEKSPTVHVSLFTLFCNIFFQFLSQFILKLPRGKSLSVRSPYSGKSWMLKTFFEIKRKRK